EDALAQLGLTDSNGQVKRELDMLFVQLPAMYASPGSVFINAGTLPAITVGVNVRAHAGAKIDVVNNSPFTMNVDDAVINDTKTVQIVNGKYTVLSPGNVYFDNVALTNVNNNDGKTISIVQKKVGDKYAYDIGGLPA